MKQRIEDKEKSGIYVIKNIVNNKVYVGKAVNIYRRIKAHVTALNTKSLDENRHLINSWHKYGRDSFTYYVAEYIVEENRDILDNILKKSELKWFNILNSLDPKKGYNMRYDSESGMTCSESTLELKSINTTNRYLNVEEKIKASENAKLTRANNIESYELSKEKLAYSNRQYKIAQCDKNSGKIIKIFEIIKEVSDEFPDFYLQAIKGCCQGTKKSYKGFRWHYVDLETNELVLKGMFSENKNEEKIKKIPYMYEKCNDLEITLKIYNSFKEIEIEHPLFKEKAIRNCCNGTTKRSGGFKWFYLNPETKERIPKNKI